MYEGSIPLEDFLHTMDALQADFEQRLKGIERAVPLKHSAEQKRSILPTVRGHEETYPPIGLEAIWTAPRRSSDQRMRDDGESFSFHRQGAFVETLEEETFISSR
ncbi:hypothetical protein [Streptomyces globisporus]|uniref:hypothetical protein n=1 Tax=Streptomyces globisporus TaxID=1908 RepID=UPI0007C47F89|nr:hypothetical protein [Streptomyces globisporus]